MGVILDILGSFIIRAAIVVVILNLMITLHQSLSKNTDRINLNESINNAAKIITSDVKLAGFRTSKAFNTTLSNELNFYADTNNTGTSHTIRYYINPTTPATVHKILYRKVDSSTPLEIARDILSFNVKYYKVDGVATTLASDSLSVKSIYVTLVMESNDTENEFYGTGPGKYSTGLNTTKLQVKWERQFFPENL
jgi:hypothetical protein